MPAASRVVLVPPQAWDEPRLLDAARRIPLSAGPLRPGDPLGELVVTGVDPAPGAPMDGRTSFEVEARPRPRQASLVDLAVLVDASESMALPWSADLTRMDAARESLASFLGHEAVGVGRISILAFHREARVLAGPAPRADLQAVDVPEPRGAARTGEALDAALAHLCAVARGDRVQCILLLSDGVGEPEAARAAAQRAARLGVPVHALVFAPEADPLFAELASLTGGSAQLAALPLTLDFVHQAGSEAS